MNCEEEFERIASLDINLQGLGEEILKTIHSLSRNEILVSAFSEVDIKNIGQAFEQWALSSIGPSVCGNDVLLFQRIETAVFDHESKLSNELVVLLGHAVPITTLIGDDFDDSQLEIKGEPLCIEQLNSLYRKIVQQESVFGPIGYDVFFSFTDALYCYMASNFIARNIHQLSFETKTSVLYGTSVQASLLGIVIEKKWKRKPSGIDDFNFYRGVR